MKTLAAILMLSVCSWAVATFSTDTNWANGTAVSATSASITVSGANPLLVVQIAFNSATATVSSVSWSLGSGTTVNVKSVRNSNTYVNTWCVPAPAAGAGTITANFSASIPFQINVELWTGADQTTPCPTGDAATVTATGGTTLTPNVLNLGARDADVCLGGLTVSGNGTGVTPNAIHNNASTTINAEDGYATGASNQCSATFNGASNVVAAVGVHIVGTIANVGFPIVE